MFAKRLDEFTSKGKGPRGTVHISKGRHNEESLEDIRKQLERLEQKLEEILVKLEKQGVA